MIVSTKSDSVFGLEIKLDNQIVFRVSELPQNFVIQPSSSSAFFISREPTDFLSRRHFVLSDENRLEIARLSNKYSNAELVASDRTYRFLHARREFLEVDSRRETHCLKELGIEVDVQCSYFNCEVRTDCPLVNEWQIAIISLLQFSRVWHWREC
jgi:hypothetical protein